MLFSDEVLDGFGPLCMASQGKLPEGSQQKWPDDKHNRYHSQKAAGQLRIRSVSNFSRKTQFGKVRPGQIQPAGTAHFFLSEYPGLIALRSIAHPLPCQSDQVFTLAENNGFLRTNLGTGRDFSLFDPVVTHGAFSDLEIGRAHV